uniref:AlNc14C133G7023 protein n=1 Tax=Albugo laibachii Nc14 TaxID=890382 RepID=F0WKH2_9STRA|nr:AlNc14C133G7023 [Albugo laibachii Nc14]|eukprot:CCA21776.1 AlNc14C133G7023 [Albugo laibachii Nc14]
MRSEIEKKWVLWMMEEFNSIEDNGVWMGEESPYNSNVLHTKLGVVTEDTPGDDARHEYSIVENVLKKIGVDTRNKLALSLKNHFTA